MQEKLQNSIPLYLWVNICHLSTTDAYVNQIQIVPPWSKNRQKKPKKSCGPSAPWLLDTRGS
jgi:hypothetical protein